ncbi:MAG: response regulator transcription factor [Janthinobacterium lividum]
MSPETSLLSPGCGMMSPASPEPPRPPVARAALSPALPPGQPVVLIVDDTPDNLALLSSALDSAGYAVLVALDGRSALERMARVLPDVILLDAIMPGMDGFETCERIKANAAYRHVPVIFMTALTETEHVVNGFRVGGIDYVTKPIRPDEVVARVSAHVRRAASQRHADLVLELSSRAAVIATGQGEIQWHSMQAPAQLAHFFPRAGAAARGAASDPDEAAPLVRLPDLLRDWLARYAGATPDAPVECTRILPDGDRLIARIAGAATRGSWIVIFEEHADRRDIAGLEAKFALTHREAEVLLWLSRGKTNRDIGQILKMMPRTVNKHLERVFVKLGVETRTAAAAAALNVARWTR